MQEAAPTKSKEAQIKNIENGSFLVGSVITLVSIVLYYSTDRDPTIAGPLFKTGVAIFFIGVILQYAETYNKCTYIRFVREGLMSPGSIGRRGRRIMRMVDGNIFKFLLPGRSYDIVDGKPVQRSSEENNLKQ
eukprot:CAMPEP_0181292278 /NCGR_PEP_ID=MMETSP1101-20121128/2420_1 /TAXON_ID=46948 /ORGANISM="Rhodomonas abbreviata, Strain Caron Lab Isolate" /LENGTH=132 /DNA_ID=CAMNT_0023396735 /DNA_START=280 /DNA_END=678 /DNA_ORIENTATION=-